MAAGSRDQALTGVFVLFKLMFGEYFRSVPIVQASLD
jgi:hypothetical protein